jgi:hypothetical protein
MGDLAGFTEKIVRKFLISKSNTHNSAASLFTNLSGPGQIIVTCQRVKKVWQIFSE